MGALARIANNRSTTVRKFMAGNRPGPPLLCDLTLSLTWDRDTIKLPPENLAPFATEELLSEN